MWACASLDRVELALHLLKVAGFTTYCPRIQREPNGRANGSSPAPLLFPNYAFIAIELQWHRVNTTPGVRKLIMDGAQPGRVPDSIIAGLRKREDGDGLITLPKPRGLSRGERIRVTGGIFQGQYGIFAGMSDAGGADRLAGRRRKDGQDGCPQGPS